MLLPVFLLRAARCVLRTANCALRTAYCVLLLHSYRHLLTRYIRMYSAGEIIRTGCGEGMRIFIVGLQCSRREQAALQLMIRVSFVDETNGRSGSDLQLSRAEELVLQPDFIRAGLTGIFFFAGRKNDQG